MEGGRRKGGSDVKRFIGEIHEAILLQRDAFLTDRERSTYMANCFGPSARDWLTGVYRTNPLLLDTFTLFVSAFRTHFGDPDESASAHRHLQDLRQTDSAVDYTSQFNRYLAAINVTQQTAIRLYQDGLSYAIRHAMVGTPRPSDLSSLQKTAIQIDHELRRLKHDTSSLDPFLTPPPLVDTPPTASLSDPDAMDIDAVWLAKGRTRRRAFQQA